MKQNSMNMEIRTIAMILFSLFSLIAATAQETNQDDNTRVKDDTNHNLEVGKSLDILNSAYRYLDLYYVDTLNPQQTVTAALQGMVRSLDPYTEYYPESATKDLQQMITGKYAGIGALVKYHQGLKRVVVDEPYEGMPAAEAGVRKGDVILSIDDSLMAGKAVGYVSSRLRGDAGTSFILRVARPQTTLSKMTFDKKGRPQGGTELSFKITRRNIKLPELPYYGILPENIVKTEDTARPKIGYVNLNQFTEGCAQNVRRALINLKQQGATSLVLDLRSNGGGSEMEAVDLVSLWLPKDELVVENRGKVQQASRVYKTRLEPIDTLMPLVVLVNGETASASEITAGALQDLDRAIVIGTRTYGKGLVQVPMDLPYNTNIKITTSKYYIPSGRCIQAINYRRDGQGGYKERIADSLTHVFHTRAGREVRDGGGIKPDVEVKNDTLPNIAYYLSVGGMDSTEVMFDYVVDYIAAHPTIGEDPTAFHLTDADYADFCQRVKESGFKYDLVSRKQFDELVKTAKQEGYYEQAREAFDVLQQALKHDVVEDLQKHKDIIRQMLELDIIAAYHYQAGSLRAGLQYDKQLQEAVKLLRDPEAIAKLLRP